MKKIILFILLFVSFAANATAGYLEQAIDSLDRLVATRQHFIDKKKNEIDKEKAGLSRVRPSELAEAYKKVAYAYRRLNIDSALYYYGKALEAADSGSRQYKRIAWARSSLMPVNGMIKDALELFESVKPEADDSAYLHEYYDNGLSLYLYISDFYNDIEHKKFYAAKAKLMNDSVLLCIPAGTEEYHFHKAYQYLFNRRQSLAVGEINEMLKNTSPDDNRYARAHSILSQYYDSEGREEEALYHLVLSAAGDIVAATQEATALQRLGMKLYKRGDVDRAYNYLMSALESSVEAGSRLRTLESAQSLPMISQAFRERDESRITVFVLLISLMVVALVVIMVLLGLMSHKQKKMNELQLRLKGNAELKDAYIGRVLSMCSLYIERMEEFNRLAGRKIKAGQVQDLYHMIESGKILQEQATQFYEVFDKTFFGIYPDFIDQVNLLLQPDKQIVLPSPGRLTPESRILAFMRLGIDDSAKLSKFLGLSLNTIYTYRNKLKARAVDRDTFERQVKEIGKIE